MNSPEISVLMPAYNAGSFVADAIYSVLRQSHSDFELVVLNDGSVDNTAEVVRRIGDSRIRFVDNDRNQGLVGVRNELLSLARGEYIAWLDADDLAKTHRLKRQLTLLKKHRDMVLVGGYVQPFSDDSSRKYKLWKYPVHSDELKSRMIFDDPIATSATMIRRDVVLRERLEFRPGYRTGEDYDFWERLSHFGAMASVPEVLAYYRIHQYQTSFSASEAERNAVLKIQGRQLDRLGVEPTPDERQLHLRLGVADKFEPEELPIVESWLRDLIAANEERGIYDRVIFPRVTGHIWYRSCFSLWRSNPQAYRIYRKSPLAGTGAPTPGKMGFLLRAIYSRINPKFG